MRHYNLNTTQRKILGGFTDLFVVDYTDFAAGVANNTAAGVTLTALAFGDYVDQPETLVEVITPFAGDASNTLDVGVTGALTQIISGQDVQAAAKTAYAPANSVAPYPTPTGGKNLIATAHPAAGDALSGLTAGQVLIWTKIIRYNDRAAGVQF
jgi:hypothetical protein